MGKKILQTFIAVVLSVAGMGSFASAASCDSSITLTGPGSNNTVDCKNVTSIDVTCNNNTYVANVNYQNGQSGNGTTAGNTSSGTAASGDVVNNNGNDVTIGTSCAPAAVTPSVPVAAQQAPGKGAFSPVTPATPAGKGSLAALPYTGANSTLATVVGSLSAAGLVFAASRFGVALYRRYGLK